MLNILTNLQTNKFKFSKSYYPFNLLPEITAFIPFIGMILFANSVLKERESRFISKLKVERLSQYFENILNSMKYSLVTFNNEEIIFYNDFFKNEIIKFEEKKGLSISNIITERNELINFNNFSSVEFFKSIKKKLKNDNFISLYDILSKYNRELLPDDELIQNGVQSANKLNIIQNNEFLDMGIFSDTSNTTFYIVMIRKYYYNENSYLIDILINDFTKIKTSEIESFETKLKQKLFSKMAHEFKTPLIIIKNLIKQNFELNENFSDENKQIATQILNMADYVSFLINDIILYSNESEIDILTSNEIINLESIVLFCYDIAKSLSIMYPGSENRVVVYNFDEDVKKYIVESDSTRIIQVMLNLISNACKFTKKGYLKISCYVKDTKDICLEVQDSGRGLSELQLKEILINNDSIIKIDTTYDYNKTGTGLGIRIVQSIIKKLNFKLEVKSELGVGSTFSIFIKTQQQLQSYNNLENNLIIDELTDMDKTLANHFETLSIINYDKILKKEHFFNLKRKFYTTSELPKLVKDEISGTNLYERQKSNFKERKKCEFSYDRINFNNSLFNDPFVHNSIDNNKEDEDFLNVIEKSDSNSNLKNRVLIVDDIESLRNSVSNLFQKYFDENDMNWEVILANDGIDTLKLVIDDNNNNNQIKLIVTDENMEYMQGSHATEILRGLERIAKIQKIRIIALTAFCDSDNISYIMSKGTDSVVVKPLSYKKLKEIMEALDN